jgi:hypothetical protein
MVFFLNPNFFHLSTCSSSVASCPSLSKCQRSVCLNLARPPSTRLCVYCSLHIHPSFDLLPLLMPRTLSLTVFPLPTHSPVTSWRLVASHFPPVAHHFPCLTSTFSNLICHVRHLRLFFFPFLAFKCFSSLTFAPVHSLSLSLPQSPWRTFCLITRHLALPVAAALLNMQRRNQKSSYFAFFTVDFASGSCPSPPFALFTSGLAVALTIGRVCSN